jgi:hypothetical protein
MTRRTIILGAFFVLLCAAVFAGIVYGYIAFKDYLAVRGDQAVEEQRQRLTRTDDEQAVLDADWVQFEKTLNDSTFENQKAYLAYIEELLAKTPDGDLKNLLVLRKGLAVTSVRGNDPETKRAALMTLGDFAYSTSTRPADTSLRDQAIIGLTHMMIQCCRLEKLPDGPYWVEFNRKREAYEARGYDEILSELLVLRDELERVSLTRQNTTDFGSDVLSIYGVIFLPPFKGQLRAEDAEAFRTDFKARLDESSAWVPPSGLQSIRDTLLAEHHIIRAYDVYQDTVGLTPERNAEIDKRYDDFRAKVDARQPQEKDQVGIEFVRLFNGLFYAESLARRYGANVDQGKMEMVIDSIVRAANANPSTKGAFIVYAKAGIYPFMKTFLTLRTDYPALAQFLAENGL